MMNAEFLKVLVTLVTALVGGVLAYCLTIEKTKAETSKIRAETEEIKAKTEAIRQHRYPLEQTRSSPVPVQVLLYRPSLS